MCRKFHECVFPEFPASGNFPKFSFPISRTGKFPEMAFPDVGKFPEMLFPGYFPTSKIFPNLPFSRNLRTPTCPQINESFVSYSLTWQHHQTEEKNTIEPHPEYNNCFVTLPCYGSNVSTPQVYPVCYPQAVNGLLYTMNWHTKTRVHFERSWLVMLS